MAHGVDGMAETSFKGTKEINNHACEAVLWQHNSY